MAGVSGEGNIWNRIDLAQEQNAGTGTGDTQVGRLSCSMVIRTVSENRARDGTPLRGKLDEERGGKGYRY